MKPGVRVLDKWGQGGLGTIEEVVPCDEMPTMRKARVRWDTGEEQLLYTGVLVVLRDQGA